MKHFIKLWLHFIRGGVQNQNINQLQIRTNEGKYSIKSEHFEKLTVTKQNIDKKKHFPLESAFFETPKQVRGDFQSLE